MVYPTTGNILESILVLVGAEGRVQAKTTKTKDDNSCLEPERGHAEGCTRVDETKVGQRGLSTEDLLHDGSAEEDCEKRGKTRNEKVGLENMF